jgi:hypothetical protein
LVRPEAYSGGASLPISDSSATVISTGTMVAVNAKG